MLGVRGSTGTQGFFATLRLTADCARLRFVTHFA
jgi:hypothetical protein